MHSDDKAGREAARKGADAFYRVAQNEISAALAGIAGIGAIRWFGAEEPSRWVADEYRATKRLSGETARGDRFLVQVSGAVHWTGENGPGQAEQLILTVSASDEPDNPKRVMFPVQTAYARSGKYHIGEAEVKRRVEKAIEDLSA